MVEYVLADISVRLDLKFPYRIKDRIKAVKRIVDRPEYEAYRNDFHRVCNETSVRGTPLVHGSWHRVSRNQPGPDVP